MLEVRRVLSGIDEGTLRVEAARVLPGLFEETPVLDGSVVNGGQFSLEDGVLVLHDAVLLDPGVVCLRKGLDMPNLFLLLHNFIFHDGSGSLQNLYLTLQFRYFSVLLLLDVLDLFFEPFVSLIQNVGNTNRALLVTAMLTPTVCSLHQV